jgi:hypothetical protein
MLCNAKHEMFELMQLRLSFLFVSSFICCLFFSILFTIKIGQIKRSKLSLKLFFEIFTAVVSVAYF